MDNIYIKSSWNEEAYSDLVDDLKALADEEYRKFHSGLVPNVKNIFGIRVPILREIGKNISRGNWKEFFKICKDDSYEETMLQGFVLNNIKVELDELIYYMDRFIVKIDNWATCDTFCSGMKTIKKHRTEFYPYIQSLLSSREEFHIRTGLVMLLAHYINDEYIDEILHISNDVKLENYYVRMANAWLIASCYSKFRCKTLNFLTNNNLDDWTYNKAIQKILESKTTTLEDSDMLKKLKRK